MPVDIPLWELFFVSAAFVLLYTTVAALVSIALSTRNRLTARIVELEELLSDLYDNCSCETAIRQARRARARLPR